MHSKSRRSSWTWCSLLASALAAACSDKASEKSVEVATLDGAPRPASRASAPPAAKKPSPGAAPTPSPSPKDSPSPVSLSEVVPLAAVTLLAEDGTVATSCMGFKLQQGVFLTSAHCVASLPPQSSCATRLRIEWLRLQDDGSLVPSGRMSTCSTLSSHYDPSRAKETDFAFVTFDEPANTPASALRLESSPTLGFRTPVVYWTHVLGTNAATRGYGFVVSDQDRISHNGIATVGTSGSPIFVSPLLAGTGPRTKQEALDLLATGAVAGLHYGLAGGFSFAIDAGVIKGSP